MDVPNRIAKSTAAGAPFGLTPKKYQSGEKDVTGVTRASAENGMITMAAPPMSLRGQTRPGRANRGTCHVRYTSESERPESQDLMSRRARRRHRFWALVGGT